MIAVTFHGAGGPEVMAVDERPDPVPQSSEVLVRATHAALNPADVAQRAGNYPAPPGSPADIPGLEVAGTVIACGEAVTAWRAGDRVFGLVGGGGLSDTVAVHERHVARIPDDLTDREAAAVPEAFITAHDAVFTRAGLALGETLLVNGASGGVGTAAVQLAKLLGLRVIGTASSAEKRARVLELGADEALSYEEFDQKLSGKNAPPLILEAVGGDVFRRSLEILPSLGRLVVFGAASKEVQPVDTLKLLFGSQGVFGLHLRAIFERPSLVGQSVKQMFEWIGQGKLKMQVGHVLPLAQIREAHELISSRKSYGKIVLAD